MTLRKQTIVLTVIYDNDKTYGKTASEIASENLLDEEGILEWDYESVEDTEVKIDPIEAMEDLRKGEK